jgi:hypothetical protein
VRAKTSGSRPEPYGRGLRAHATVRQRAAVLAGAVVLVVFAALAWLDHSVLPVVLTLLVVDAVLLARLRTALRRRCLEDRRISDEATRGLRELERWLAFGERA